VAAQPNPLPLFLLAALTSSILADTLPNLTFNTLSSRSTTQLEQRLIAIDTQIANLASYSLRGGVGAIGYRSQTHPQSESNEWIEITLSQESPVDQIVLVPAIWRDNKSGFRADGFPEEFRILVGTDDDPEGKVIATYGPQDRLLPRIAPLVVPCPNTRACWVRLEATRLASRAWDGQYDLQLAEIFIFNGAENVALHQQVTTSSIKKETGARDKRFLVDGFTPYLMDAADGDKSIAMVSDIHLGEAPTITLDLGDRYPIDRIHFHSIDLSDTVPQANDADFGMPRRMLFEGALTADFSDAIPLVEYQMESIYDAGPIIMLRFQQTPCRYLRVTAIEPFLNTLGTQEGAQIGSAELEVFANGRNVALGKLATANFSINDPHRRIEALTDGHNFSGEILPIRDWLEELAERRDLELERPMVSAELGRRYARQKDNLTLLGWLTISLAAGIGLSIYLGRTLQKRKVAEIKERFAADLHDELGANLHTIRLLGDVALNALDSPERLKTVLRRSQELAERTSDVVRNGVNFGLVGGLHENPREEMLRCAQRILADVHHDISIEGGPLLAQLQATSRADLILFYKESLINISRHSGATHFTTRLMATPALVELVVSDNGKGIHGSGGNGVPASLKRRARLLGAQVSAGKSLNGGATITLKFKPRKLLPST
jgi:signal transduction histidine kinase